MKKLIKQTSGAKQLIFLDFEGTQFSHELIAIGAYKVFINRDGSIKKIFPGFKLYVRAKKAIGRYVVDLTKITEDFLAAEGIPFDLALREFKKYVGKGITKTKFVTFGAHDMRILRQSANYTPEADHAFIKLIHNQHIDLANVISEYIKDGKNTLSLAKFCELFGVEPIEPLHDPQNDALMLAKLYEQVLKQTDLVAARYQEVLFDYTNLPRPLAKAFKKLKKDQVVTYADLLRFIREELQ